MPAPYLVPYVASLYLECSEQAIWTYEALWWLAWEFDRSGYRPPEYATMSERERVWWDADTRTRLAESRPLCVFELPRFSRYGAGDRGKLSDRAVSDLWNVRFGGLRQKSAEQCRRIGLAELNVRALIKYDGGANAESKSVLLYERDTGFPGDATSAAERSVSWVTRPALIGAVLGRMHQGKGVQPLAALYGWIAYQLSAGKPVDIEDFAMTWRGPGAKVGTAENVEISLNAFDALKRKGLLA